MYPTYASHVSTNLMKRAVVRSGTIRSVGQPHDPRFYNPARITNMSPFRRLTKLLPLVVVCAVATIVAMAARSPLPPAARLPEVGIEVSDLKPAVARVDAELAARWKAANIAPAGEAPELQILRRL